MEILQLYDKDKNKIAGLTKYKDLCIENVLATGDKTLSFSYPKEDEFYDLIEEEDYIRTKKQEYVIKAKDVNRDYTAFNCVLNLEELEAKILDRFESKEQTITNALNLTIVGTGWTVKENTLKKKRTVRLTNKNVLDIVKEIKKTYRVDIVFNTLEKQIEIHEHLGKYKGSYFIDSLNLKALQVQSDSYKYITRIIAEGKNGLTFSDINGGKKYVENYQYSKKVKAIYWKDERYTVKENLLADAKAKLEELSKPFRAYSASVLNLAELNPKYKNILEYQLGDTITLIAKDNKVKDKQRIVKTIEWLADHTKDTVELANTTLKFEDIQKENQETTDTVNNITTDNGTLNSDAIEDNSIKVKKIDNFEANVIQVTNLHALNADIDNLHANKADIQDLNAVTAKIGTLNATKANITQLNAANVEISKLNAIKANITDLQAVAGKISVLESKTASIDNLASQKASIDDLKALNATISDALIKKATIAEVQALETKTNKLIAEKANIKDLNATNANVNSLQADTAKIKTLINGNLSSENIQTGGITSDKLTIANGFINNLMISSVSASKITTGTIDAAKINVVNLNADNLTVGKINGHLIKKGSISGLAINDGAIDNNKVSPNANIEASKLNISSVVTSINNGSTLLNANKVAIDANKGTLDIAFNNLNTSLEVNKKATESNSTTINVVQGKLNASIENSKVLEGKQKTLEDNYNRTVVTVNSLKNSIGQHKMLIDSATGKITNVEIKTNTLEKNLSGLTQTVTDTKKVIEDNKITLESKAAELKANIDKISSSLSSVSSTVDKNNKALITKTNVLEQNLSGLTQSVANNKTDTDGKIISINNTTHELKAGLGGLTSKLDSLKSTTDGINKTVINQGSEISQLQNSIKLKVDSSTFTKSTTVINNNINKAKEDAINTANNNTTNAIDKMEVGNENLLDDSERERTNYPNKQGEYLSVNITDIIKSNLGKQIVLSGEIKSLGEDGSIDIYSLGKYQFNSSKSVKCTTKEFIPFELVITPTYDLNGYNGEACNWSFYGIYGSGIYPCVRKLKVSLGNKKSSWSPSENDLKKYVDDVAKAKADLAKQEAIASADGKITEEERKRIQQAEANLNTAIARADKAKADAKAYSDTLGQQLKANAEKYANDVAIAKSELAKQQAIANSDGKINAEEKNRITEAKKNLDTAIARANSAESKAKSYADIKKQEAIKTAENLALEKSNLAKKYAEDVATSKANLAKTEAIASADGKIDVEEKARIKQAQDNLNTAISKVDKAKQDAILEANKVAELKKQQAINSANSHADSKANDALNSAKAYVNTQITTVNSNLSKATTELNLLKGQISSKVSQTDVDNTVIKYKTQNYGYLYKKDIVIHGDYNLYYPVIIKRGNQDVKRKIFVNRGYSEQAPSEWNPSLSTHHGGLSLLISTNFGGWGGANYSWSIYDLEEQYSRMFAGAVNCASNMAFAIFLRGGGEKGAIYHLYSDQPLNGEMPIKEGIPKPSVPQIAYNEEMIGFYEPAYEFYAPKPRTITPEVEEEIKKRKFIQLSQTNANEIVETNNKISTVESTLVQKTNSIEAGVRDLNSTTKSITSNVSNINRDLTNKINSNLNTAKAVATDIATSRANSAKQEAINSSNSHADIVASNKATEALNNAKSYTNAQVSTVNTKVHNVESSLNILSDRIGSKVSQSDVDKSISTIQIGGRNLVQSSNYFVKGGGANGLSSKINSDGTLSITSIKNNGNWFTSFFKTYEGIEDNLNEDESFTISFTMKSSDTTTKPNIYIKSGMGYFTLKGTLSSEYSTLYYTGTWKKNNSIAIHLGFGYVIGTIQILNCKIEKGNKPTDWTPAPEDTDQLITDSIKVVDSKISDISSNVIQLKDSVTTQINSINSTTHSIETTLNGKASKQEVSTVDNKVSTIKASLNSITQRVSSTESKAHSLETSLNGKASKQDVTNVSNKVTSLEANVNGITSRVSSTEGRINTLNGQVQNATTKQEFTEFKQSSQNAILNIQNTSGVNYVSNPIFNTGDLTGWEIWHNGTSWAVKDDTSLSHKYSLKLHCTASSQGVCQRIPGFVYGKKYTYKVKVWTESGTPGIMVSNANTWDGAIFQSSQGYNKWVELTFQFTALEGTMWVYIGTVNSQSPQATFWVSEIMLYEGCGEIPFSDNPKELYSSSFQADLNGLKCVFEDKSYSKMGRDGFEMWKNGMAHPYHCLITQGVVNHLDFNSGNYEHRVYLPPEFRGKHFTVQTMIQGWNFPNGNVSGTMASGRKNLDYGNGQFTIYFNGGGNYKTNCNIAYVVIA